MLVMQLGRMCSFSSHSGKRCGGVRLPCCLLRFCLALFLEQICHPHLGFAWIAIPFVLDRMNNVKSSDP
jgi:hypothetical protein